MNKTITMLGTRGFAGRTFIADKPYKVIDQPPAEEDEILASHADILVSQGHAEYKGKTPLTARSEVAKPVKGANKPIGEGEAPKRDEP